MNLIAVPPDRAGEFWPLARGYIYAALDRTGLNNPRNVEFDVLSGHALLWLIISDPVTVCGAVVTQPQDDALWIVAYGCDDHKRAAPLLATIEDYGRAAGCRAVRLMGRRGWERALPGYRTAAVILEKEMA